MVLPNLFLPDVGESLHERDLPCVNFEYFHARQDLVHQLDPLVLCLELLRLEVFAEFAEEQVERNQDAEDRLKLKHCIRLFRLF